MLLPHHGPHGLADALVDDAGVDSRVLKVICDNLNGCVLVVDTGHGPKRGGSRVRGDEMGSLCGERSRGLGHSSQPVKRSANIGEDQACICETRISQQVSTHT